MPLAIICVAMIVAAVQGTGWVTVSMRTMDIMRAISESESRIMQLRD